MSLYYLYPNKTGNPVVVFLFQFCFMSRLLDNSGNENKFCFINLIVVYLIIHSLKQNKMNLDLKVKIDGGIGKNLYLISVSDDFQTINHYYLGNDDTDVLTQFFKKNGCDEEFVMDTYKNVGWVYNEDWDEDEYEGEGYETIGLELIGEVI